MKLRSWWKLVEKIYTNVWTSFLRYDHEQWNIIINSHDLRRAEYSSDHLNSNRSNGRHVCLGLLMYSPSQDELHLVKLPIKPWRKLVFFFFGKVYEESSGYVVFSYSKEEGIDPSRLNPMKLLHLDDANFNLSNQEKTLLF